MTIEFDLIRRYTGAFSNEDCEGIIKDIQALEDQSFLSYDKDFYFVHSYFVDPVNKSEILSTTNYGYTFTSGVFRDNLVAIQFHPEKSSSDGLKVLKNFITWDIS